MRKNGLPIPTPEYPAEKKSSSPWNFWQTIAFGLIIALAYFGTQILLNAIIEARDTVSYSWTYSKLFSSVTSGDVLVAILFISFVVGSGFIILFVKMRKGISFKEYLALRSIKIRTYFIVLGILVALLIVLGFATSGLDNSKFTNQWVQAYRSSTIPLLLWMAVVVIGPVFEEIFFRGFLFTGFRESKVGVTGAILLTAVLWTFAHANHYVIWQLIVVFVLGVVFGIVRWRTNSLYATLSMHSLWNLVSMIQIVLLIQGRIR